MIAWFHSDAKTQLPTSIRVRSLFVVILVTTATPAALPLALRLIRGEVLVP